MEHPPSLFDGIDLISDKQDPYSGNPLVERSAYRKKRNLERIAMSLIKDAMFVSACLIDPIILKINTPKLTKFGRTHVNTLTTAYLLAIAFALHEVKNRDRLTSILFSDLLVAMGIIKGKESAIFYKELESAVYGCIESCGLMHAELVQFAKEHFSQDSQEEHEYRVVFQGHTEWLRNALYGTVEGADAQQYIFVQAAKEFYNEYAKPLLLDNK